MTIDKKGHLGRKEKVLTSSTWVGTEILDFFYLGRNGKSLDFYLGRKTLLLRSRYFPGFHPHPQAGTLKTANAYAVVFRGLAPLANHKNFTGLNLYTIIN